MSTKPNRRDLDELRLALLELYYDCSEQEGVLRQRIEREPTVAQLWDEVQLQGRVLDEAAHTPMPQFKLTMEDSAQAEQDQEISLPETLRPQSPWWRTWRVAASFILVVFTIAPLVAWQWNAHQLKSLTEERTSLILTGPVGIPDASPGYFKIEAVNAKGEPKSRAVTWRALDEQGALVASGVEPPAKHHDVVLSPALKSARSMKVELVEAENTTPVSIDLSPTQGAPLCHLTCDRPIYEPGNIVRFRAVILDRVSLSPMMGAFRVRLSDPKETEVSKVLLTAENGVLRYGFQIPQEAPGGTWNLELRDGKSEFTVQALPFQVQRNAARQFATVVDLDRTSYAPGSKGRAEIRSRRLNGGSLAGSDVSLRITSEGRSLWDAAGKLDAQGATTLSFTIPPEVKFSEASAVATIRTNDHIETVVEPVFIPLSEVLVQWYPEGGDLIADLDARVYFEATDALGRPVDCEGQILDRDGTYVTATKTLMDGYGIVNIPADARFPLRMAFTSPKASAVQLPTPNQEGIALSVPKASTAAGDPIICKLAATETGPWIVGVFCRGQLVGSQTVQASSTSDLVEVDVPENVGGVLRVTVFDHAMKPRAERLVHRASTQKLQVSVAAVRDVSRPGGEQELEITTRDETGEPVAAVLGISVSDAALDARVRRKRIGLHDRTFLFDGMGAEGLETVAAVMVDDQEESLRNLDLILGTQGWRRFGWHDPEAFVSHHGLKARKALVLEGNPQTPQVADGREAQASEIATKRGQTEHWKDKLRGALSIAALCAILIALWFKRGPRYSRASIALRGVATLSLGVLVVASQPGLGPAASVTGMLERSAPDGGVIATTHPLRKSKTSRIEDGLVVYGYDPRTGTENLGDAQRLGVTLFLNHSALGELDGIGTLDSLRLGRPVSPLFKLESSTDAFTRSRNLQSELTSELALLAPLLSDAYRPYFSAVTTATPRFEMSTQSWQWTREYIHRHPKRKPNAARTDFAQTLYWNPLAKTNDDGKISIKFDLSELATSWLVQVEGHGRHRVGQTSTQFLSRMPLSLAPTWPTELTEGDRVQIPVGVSLEAGGEVAAQITAVSNGSLEIQSPSTLSLNLEQGLGRALIDVTVKEGEAQLGGGLALGAEAAGFTDKVAHTLRIRPRGFPQERSWSGVVSEPHQFLVNLPSNHRPNSLGFDLSFYPSPLSTVIGGLEGMLREPTGCFEQTSSKNYPNVMALQLLQTSSDGSPALMNRSRALVERGYTRLKTFQCKDGGFDWYAGGSGKTGLTAYGLVQFQDMGRIHDVEESLMNSTKSWLLSMRDGQGGFKPGMGAHAFAARDPDTLNPYVLWALLSAKAEAASLKTELDACEDKLQESRDPYHLALGALVFDLANRGEAAKRCLKSLANLQVADGSIPGARSTLTASRGDDRLVETTALASLAWLNTTDFRGQSERSVRWLMTKRRGGGTFGATQATVLAMKALVKYSESQTPARTPSKVSILLNGKKVATLDCDPRRADPMTVNNLTSKMNVGANLIELSLDKEEASVPFACQLSYYSDQPADDSGAPVALETSFANQQPSIIEGGTVAISVKLLNLRSEGVTNAMATLGLPATLSIEDRILDRAKDAGHFAHWERNGREITLYLRGLKASEERRFALEATAEFPGQTTGPASRAWLYYDSKRVSWTKPLALTVTPKR